MLVVYDSLTGLGKNFADRLGKPTCDVVNFISEADDDIFLITRSIDFGKIPDTTVDFLLDYHDLVCGVAVTGNKIWGTNYGAAGYKIEKEYNIPLIHVFELNGFSSDSEKVRTWIDNYIKERGHVK